MNPLNSFLNSVQATRRIGWGAAAQQAVRPDQYAALTLNQEEINYASDILMRVEMLSFVYDRLCELRLDYFDIHEAMCKNQTHANSIDLSKVSPADLERDRRWKLEVDIITTFAYYELKSIVDMLRGWGIQITGAELEYILKSRDRFLAHPCYGGVMRLAHRGRSIPHDPGPVGVSIGGLNQWGPITRQNYLDTLQMTTTVDENAEREKNEQLVRSRDQNHRLDPQEIMRLKAFGVREADLPTALTELASILEQHAFPKIEAAFQEAVSVFGFQRH
jgi:hypothetical protein